MDIQEVSILQKRRITDDSSKTNPSMPFENMTNLALRENTITDAAVKVPAIDLEDARNLVGCDSYIMCVNHVHEIWLGACKTNPQDAI